MSETQGRPRRIAMFGGSFNPVHAGHMALCRAARDTCWFDELLLVPDNLPPHKSAAGLCSNEDRLAMLEIAVREEPGIRISRLEYELGGKSYTIRTLRALQEQYPGAELYLIIGADMLFTFREWRDWQGILALAKVIAAARSSVDGDGGADEFAALEECRAGYGALADRIELLRHPVIDVSSTRLRELLAQGEDPGELLPAGVYDYIRRHGLYRAGEPDAQGGTNIEP